MKKFIKILNIKTLFLFAAFALLHPKNAFSFSNHTDNPDQATESLKAESSSALPASGSDVIRTSASNDLSIKEEERFIKNFQGMLNRSRDEVARKSIIFKAFEKASAKGLEISLGLLLNNFGKHKRYVNASFVSAAFSGNIRILERLLQNRLFPNQEAINDAFYKSACKNHQNVMGWMYSKNMKPDRIGINSTFAEAAENSYQNILAWMTQNDLIPDQEGVNEAYESAAENEHRNILDFMWDNNLDPDEQTTVSLYEEVCTRGINDIATFLEQRFPNFITEDIRNQHGRGRSYEVHKFSDNTKNQALEHIIKRLKDNNEQPEQNVEYETSVQIIKDSCGGLGLEFNEIIEGYFNTSKEEDKNTINIILKFVQKFHPDKLDTWVNGFIKESLEAYSDGPSSSAPPTSRLYLTTCFKGFWERAITGLRDLNDEGINMIFKGAESHLLGQKKINHFLSPRIMAELLTKAGLSKNATLPEAKAKMREELTKKFVGEDALLNFAFDILEAPEVSEIIYQEYIGLCGQNS